MMSGYSHECVLLIYCLYDVCVVIVFFCLPCFDIDGDYN